MAQKYFLAGILGFTGGIFLRSFVTIGFFYAVLIAVTGIIFAGFHFAARQKGLSLHFVQLLIPVFLIAFSLGIFRVTYSERGVAEILQNFTGKSVEAEGIISDDPDRRELNTHLTITLDKIAGEKVDFKILAIADRKSFSYGDRVSLKGTLEKPESFLTNDGKEFDYAAYLAKDDIRFIVNKPKLEVISTGGGNPIKRVLFSIKNAFIKKLDAQLPKTEAGVLEAILLGTKHSFSQDISDEFRRSGVIHILVLSGYHVSQVGSAIQKFFSFLPRASGAGLGVLGIILFAVLSGGSATAIRASIMACFSLFAQATGRTYDAARALVVAALIMTLWNPKILVFDTSFQLSFLATLALIYVSPIAEHYLKFLPNPKRFKIREIVVSTLAAEIFLLPFLIFVMGQFSLVGLPANVLILPLVSPLMFIGFVTGLLGLLSTGLALPIAYIAHYFLAYILSVVHFFSSFSFSNITVRYFPFLLMLVIYIFYAWLIIHFHKQKTPSLLKK